MPHKAIEVGNIFALGTRFSVPLGLTYLDEAGKDLPVWMGSYGLGPSRLLGTVAEVLSDEHGLVWPRAIAPFLVHLVCLSAKDNEVAQAADKLSEFLEKSGVEVLLDDREASAGEKFTEADLLGLPFRVVISSKTLAEGKWEVKDRRTGEVLALDNKALLQLVHA